MENCWLLNNKCLETIPEGYFGFVYLITLTVPCIFNNIEYQKDTIYIGKKFFTFRKKSKLSRKARVGTRKRVKVEQIDSGWNNYFGSSKELKELVQVLGEGSFKREILHLCKSKTELSYMELYEQITRRVLFVPSFNGWISARIYRKHL